MDELWTFWAIITSTIHLDLSPAALWRSQCRFFTPGIHKGITCSPEVFLASSLPTEHPMAFYSVPDPNHLARLRADHLRINRIYSESFNKCSKPYYKSGSRSTLSRNEIKRLRNEENRGTDKDRNLFNNIPAQDEISAACKTLDTD
jgi:hypothetical protein